MKKKYGDLVASDMLLNLASDENLALFHKEYKPSKDSSDEHFDHKHSHESCEHEDSSEEELDHDEEVEEEDEDEEDYDNVYYALDTAVANLINASAALDAVGFEKSASLSLKIANFVAVAKKKTKDKKNKKKNPKDSSKNSKKMDPKDSKKPVKKEKDQKDSGKNSKKMDSKNSGKSSKDSNKSSKKKVAQIEGYHEVKQPFEHKNIANEVQSFVDETVKSLNLKPVYKVVYAAVSPDTGVLSLKIGYPESASKESSMLFSKLKQTLVGKTLDNTPVKSVSIIGMFGNY